MGLDKNYSDWSPEAVDGLASVSVKLIENGDKIYSRSHVDSPMAATIVRKHIDLAALASESFAIGNGGKYWVMIEVVEGLGQVSIAVDSPDYGETGDFLFFSGDVAAGVDVAVANTSATAAAAVSLAYMEEQV